MDNECEVVKKIGNECECKSEKINSLLAILLWFDVLSSLQPFMMHFLLYVKWHCGFCFKIQFS